MTHTVHRFAPSNRRTRTRLLLAAVCLALAMMTVAVAPAGADTYRFKLRGQEAVAAFSSVDPSGCVVTDAFVAAMDADVRSGSGPSDADSRTFAVVSQYDRCTQTRLSNAYGEVLLPPEAFVISEREWATLDAEIVVVDQVSGTARTLSVDLSWQATGPTSRVRDHFHVTSPGFRVNARFAAVSREATAAGSISDGTTQYAPEPARFALLNSVTSGVLEIHR